MKIFMPWVNSFLFDMSYFSDCHCNQRPPRQQILGGNGFRVRGNHNLEYSDRSITHSSVSKQSVTQRKLWFDFWQRKWSECDVILKTTMTLCARLEKKLVWSMIWEWMDSRKRGVWAVSEVERMNGSRDALEWERSEGQIPDSQTSRVMFSRIVRGSKCRNWHGSVSWFISFRILFTANHTKINCDNHSDRRVKEPSISKHSFITFPSWTSSSGSWRVELSSHDSHPSRDRKRDTLPSNGKPDNLFGM